MEELIFTNDINNTIDVVCDGVAYDRAFVLCDENTRSCVVPLLTSQHICKATIITMASGDEAKNLTSLSHVWQMLSDGGASRHSLLINIGGGVVTDLGGLAAATFKRGMSYINIPTTLLGAVDAAVGGKTGINFAGLKNEIGVFNTPLAVIISTLFYATLPREELLSGYAEMIKHALIDGTRHYTELLDCDVTMCDADRLLSLLQRSVAVKQRIVKQDPHEKGVRKMLNLGHSIAHAFESHALAKGEPIRHGYAVAWGLVCELLIAHRKLNFPSSHIYDLARYVEQYYGAYAITCEDYDGIYELLLHDKKNRGGVLNFTLMRDMGVCEINCQVDKSEIEVALDFYRDLFHL